MRPWSQDGDSLPRPGPVYTGSRHPVWWYLSELPQGRNAARVGELFQVRGVSLCVRVADSANRPAARNPGYAAWLARETGHLPSAPPPTRQVR
ncbi:hypothetical protein GCM10009845_23440 [Pedococcus bigeumensis]